MAARGADREDAAGGGAAADEGGPDLPLVKSWRGAYLVVLGNLALLVLLFWLLRRAYE